ncbi:GATA transcription factor 17 [Tanacetum coccineum]
MREQLATFHMKIGLYAFPCNHCLLLGPNNDWLLSYPFKTPELDLAEESSSMNCEETLTKTDKVCTDCNTAKTPLWHAGPAGPKLLCNACGIRFKKKGPRQPSPPSSASSATVGSGKEDFSPRSEACVEEMKDGKFRKKLRIKIVALGKEVLIQRPRSPMKKVVRKHFRNIQIQNQYKNLGEVEQAAHLLMSLSCGSVFWLAGSI